MKKKGKIFKKIKLQSRKVRNKITNLKNTKQKYKKKYQVKFFLPFLNSQLKI